MVKIIRHEIGRDRMYKIWHRAEGNMLLYVHKGVGSIVSPEHVYPLQSGVLCFIGSQVLHHTLPNLSTTYDRSKIFISDAMLERLSPLLGIQITPHSILYGKVKEDVEKIFEWIEEYGESGGYLQLLLMLSKHIDNHAHIGTSSVDRAISYIQKNINDPITIDDICTAVHASKFHFCRKFKERTGYTVMKYILKTRISVACNMIEQGQHNMAHISESCGFSSPAYFSRVFKDEIGKSPMQYKKSIQK